MSLQERSLDKLCQLCAYKTWRPANLVAHIRRCHDAIKQFKCASPDCDYTASERQLLERHNIKYHGKPSRHLCNQCDYAGSCKPHLENHIRRKHCLPAYKCTLCPYAAQEKKQLYLHVNSVHYDNLMHVCLLCTFKTVRKENLNRHISTVHKKSRNYRCHQCTYTGGARINLERHLKNVHGIVKKLRDHPVKIELAEALLAFAGGTLVTNTIYVH